RRGRGLPRVGRPAARVRPASRRWDMSAPSASHARPGPLGRLGRWSARHLRPVALVWAVVVIVLGAFAPQVHSTLSGAGWEDSGSESVAARTELRRAFDGADGAALMVVVSSREHTATDGPFRATVDRVVGILTADDRVAAVQ